VAASNSQTQIRDNSLPYNVFHLESWEGFLELVTSAPYSNWAFRGQSDEEWPLFSALSRYFHSFKINPEDWVSREERMLRIFKRKAHHFLSHIPDPDDDFEWLALMQHHGAPTRLLDFTWSPYVAVFFALEKATRDAALWALNPGMGRGHDLREKDSYERYFLRGQTSFVWIGEPYIMNRRLIAQSGTFAVPSTLNEPLENILSGYKDPKNTLAKFILSRDRVRDEGMRELYRMNITHATLFPDLDGLARSLAYELEFQWW